MRGMGWMATKTFKILKYPENKLMYKSKNVDIKDHKKLVKLAFKMINTMKKHNGVGLAAPQIGININLFIASINGVVECIINPKIVYCNGSEVGVEGCLSIEEKYKVMRYETIVVNYYSLHLMKYIEKELTGFDARIFQHEYDHLFGRLINEYEVI